MSQVNRTVNYLIESAFHLMGEYADGEELDGTAFQRGLDLLNDMINAQSTSSSYIALTKNITFNLVANQSDYVVSNINGITADVVANRIVEILYCQLIINDFSFKVEPIDYTEVYTNSFSLNATGVPSFVLLKKSEQYSTLSFFPTPAQQYQCVLWAKFYLDQFQLNSPIKNVPLGLQKYLKYALARELLAYYPSANWPQTAEEQYQSLLNDLQNTNDMDRTVRTSNLLKNRGWYSGFGYSWW